MKYIMKSARGLLGVFFFLFSIPVLSQDALNPELHINKAVDEIVLDGRLDEQSWQNAEVAQGFYQHFPFDTSFSVTTTEVRLTYNDDMVYASAICRDPKPGSFVTPSLRRDFRGGGNDVMTFIFDTFQDQTNGVILGVNPFGVQREGLISNGGLQRSDFDLSWDNKWYSEVQVYEGYWIVEIAIPFKTLRYKEGQTEWNITFYRLDSKTNERSVWPATPRELNLYNLGYAGKLVWDEALGEPGTNISLIPYVAAGHAIDYEDTDENGDPLIENNLSVGGDAKIAVTPSLNLDLTVNPDFSQVEVDRQVTNLDRFEIFFPERRQFFLENADLFANFGFDNARPFFSRRIGVAIDTSTSTNVQNPIYFGARLSGRVDDNWRVGLLNMQAGGDDEINLPSFNYTVGAVQRQVFAQSNISLIAVNKQSFTDTLNNGNDLTLNSGNYNRLFGLEYNLASADNSWAGKAFYHQSFDPGVEGIHYSHGARLTYRKLRYQFTWEHQVVSENYNAEVGFVRRTGIRSIAPGAELNFYPSGSNINQHGPQLSTSLLWNNDGVTDYRVDVRYNFSFLDNSNLSFQYSNNYVLLLDDFGLIDDAEEIPEGENFAMNRFQVSYRSDSRKLFFYDLEVESGEFFGGYLNRLGTELNFAFRPYGVLSVTGNYNRIRLAEEYGEADYFLLGPRLDLTFTRSIFLTAFAQYNNQAENFNINTRLQWRFQPVSDVFLVYTENYLPQDFTTKNRSLVFKITYWLNL